MPLELSSAFTGNTKPSKPDKASRTSRIAATQNSREDLRRKAALQYLELEITKLLRKSS